MIKTLHIFSNADQNYFDGLVVSIISALNASSGQFNYHFHILNGDIHTDSITLLNGLIHASATKKGIHADITFHQIDLSQLSHLPQWRGSHMTYTKMLIPELIPLQNSAIYVDSDTLLNRGVEDIFLSPKPKGTLIAGVRDYYHSLKREHPTGAVLSDEDMQSPYINAGVMWLNLAGLREINILESTAKVIKAHPDILKGDQTLFNYVCRNRIHLLSDENNLCLSLGTGMRVVKKWPTTNLHYIGKDKPWFCRPSTTQFFAQSLWHQKALEYGLYNEPKLSFPDIPLDLAKVKKKRWTNIFNSKRATRYRNDLESLNEVTKLKGH